MQIQCKIKKLSPLAVVPAYATAGSAGFDFSSIVDVVLKSKDSLLIDTGLAFEIPLGYELQLRPRSGLAFKHQVTILNAPATIDSDYRGEIKVLLINHSNKDFEIKIGDRIAQGVIAKLSTATFVEVEELSSTARGEGGFGSSGTNINNYQTKK